MSSLQIIELFEKPTLSSAAKKLNITESQLDVGFGLVLINKSSNLYAVRIHDKTIKSDLP